MNPWDLASAIAILAAGVPPLYFAVRLRGPGASSRLLVLLLAASLFVHGAFHLLDALSVPEATVLIAESLSAVLILVFAIAYWQLRGEAVP